MATEVNLHDLKRQVESLPVSQRLILAGELVKKGAAFADLGISIAENAVSEWQALKLLNGRR